MCTGNGFSQVHQSGVGSFGGGVNAWLDMTNSLSFRVSRGGELLAGDGGGDESAG
jgi:hypothetical protein